MFGFQLGQDFFGPFIDLSRHACQPGHVDTVTLVGGPLDDLVEENHVLFPLAYGHVQVFYPRQRTGQGGQFMVMRGEQCPTTNDVVQMFHDCPGE